MKRVVVVGSAGQDGTILCEQLRDAEVVGVDVGGPTNVLVAESIEKLVREVAPDELYYLAAYHHAAEDAQGSTPALLRASFDAHVTGFTNALEAIATRAPACRVFYASSSHVFGAPASPTQDESTPIAPINAYGITKAAGMHVARLYRRRGVFASSGVLYNHESTLRAPSFVSRKIVDAARAKKRVRLGRLDAVVDWGFADDTVRAMRAILAHTSPDDFVVATGVPHTVRDFAAVAYASVGADWREYVDEDATVLQKEHITLVGDSRKLRAMTGWSPSVSFEEMVAKLVDARA